MVRVGINEGVVISRAFMNDKKRLVLEVGEPKTAGPRNYFDESLTAGVESESKGMDLTILGPLASKKEDKTLEQKLSLLASDFLKLKNQLTQILMQYMTVEKIDITALDIQYANTGITSENFMQVALDQDKIDRRYENICNRFIQLITPFLNDPQYKLRFKLIRQSKDKHYATIPGRFIDQYPFVELMDVPAEHSKVKFSDWEKSQGLDSDAPVQTASAEPKAPAAVGGAVASPFAGSNPSPFAPQ